jgi:hypothetical protein
MGTVETEIGDRDDGDRDSGERGTEQGWRQGAMGQSGLPPTVDSEKASTCGDTGTVGTWVLTQLMVQSGHGDTQYGQAQIPLVTAGNPFMRGTTRGGMGDKHWHWQLFFSLAALALAALALAAVCNTGSSGF